MTDKDILNWAREWHKQANTALEKSIGPAGSDHAVKFNTSSVLLDGRLVKFTDAGEPYFSEGG